MKIVAGMVLIVAAPGGPPIDGARADLKGRAARELTWWAIRRSAGPAAREGAEALVRRVEALAARHGDEVVTAVHEVGPGALRLVEGAGTQGGLAARLLARHGERAAWVAADSRRLALVARHGDAAAGALVRHRRVAEPLVKVLGEPAARALAAVGPRNARRLAMMTETGELARLARPDELLEVVGRFGDRAMEFVWKHKGALAVGTALTAFLADPGPFLGGARDLAGVVVATATRPVTELPGRVMTGAVRRTDWTSVVVAVLGLVAGLALGGIRLRRLAGGGPRRVRRGPDEPTRRARPELQARP
jgi:hypothetical protein